VQRTGARAPRRNEVRDVMDTLNKVPSELDWGDFKSDRDVRYAHEQFFDKNLDEALIRFENHVLAACEDLRFMPAIPFRYYMLAFRSHLLEPRILESTSAPDAANCFLGLVLGKLRDSFEDICPILSEIMPTVEYVAKNQVLFDADIDIYGDFSEILAEIKHRVNEARSSCEDIETGPANESL